jgi:hypothetical protein
MLNDISLPAIGAAHAGSTPVTEQRAPAAEPVQAVSAAPPITNPTLRLDAALGLVVIEFRNQGGGITTSIPSQRQLQAYQRWQTTRLGPAPDWEANQHTARDIQADP